MSTNRKISLITHSMKSKKLLLKVLLLNFNSMRKTVQSDFAKIMLQWDKKLRNLAKLSNLFFEQVFSLVKTIINFWVKEKIVFLETTQKADWTGQ